MKFVKLEPETTNLLREVKANLLLNSTNKTKTNLTDDITIRIALTRYLKTEVQKTK